MERGHLHGAHDDLETRVVLDEEAHAVVEPHRGRGVQRSLAVQLHVVRLSPVNGGYSFKQLRSLLASVAICCPSKKASLEQLDMGQTPHITADFVPFLCFLGTPHSPP